jgi:hypothetical protein
MRRENAGGKERRNPFTVGGFTKAWDLSSSDCIAMER